MKKAKIIALLAALAVACGSWYILSMQLKREREETVYVSVVVAKDNLAVGTVIDETMITYKKIPPKYVQSGAVPEVHADEVFGKVVKYPIVSGEPVVSERIGEQGEAATGLSSLVNSGMRAYSLAVETDSGVAGMILPGNRVDILYSYEEPLPGEEGTSARRYRCRADYILKSIEVLAVDQKTDNVRTDVMGDLMLYESVTLSVTPQDAIMLAAYQQSIQNGTGKIRLLLRKPGDQESEDVSAKEIEVTKE